MTIMSPGSRFRRSTWWSRTMKRRNWLMMKQNLLPLCVRISMNRMREMEFSGLRKISSSPHKSNNSISLYSRLSPGWILRLTSRPCHKYQLINRKPLKVQALQRQVTRLARFDLGLPCSTSLRKSRHGTWAKVSTPRKSRVLLATLTWSKFAIALRMRWTSTLSSRRVSFSWSISRSTSRSKTVKSSRQERLQTPSLYREMKSWSLLTTSVKSSRSTSKRRRKERLKKMKSLFKRTRNTSRI